MIRYVNPSVKWLDIKPRVKWIDIKPCVKWIDLTTKMINHRSSKFYQSSQWNVLMTKSWAMHKHSEKEWNVFWGKLRMSLRFLSQSIQLVINIPNNILQTYMSFNFSLVPSIAILFDSESTLYMYLRNSHCLTSHTLWSEHFKSIVFRIEKENLMPHNIFLHVFPQ
jgi:hypothetical protein